MEKLASKETRTSGGDKNKNEQFVNHIITMFEKLEPPGSTEYCRIYKVPYNLRKVKKDAYTPQVLSIGPIHHGKDRFQIMEGRKVDYVNSFMNRYGIDSKLIVSTIKGMEDRIQRCYVDTVLLESFDFVNMIALDASFILVLFLKPRFGGWGRDDPAFIEAWLLNSVVPELLLLENQLPFFVIKELYDLLLPFLPDPIPLIQLTFEFFKPLNIQNKSPDPNVTVEIQHLTDLLRFFLLPPQVPNRVGEVIFPKYSITQLYEAGVNFKVVPSKCLQDLNFKKGVLEIPLLEFDDLTEVLVRNIMALEQCDRKKDPYISDFYLILDHLIDTTKDVDLLNRKRILINDLGDSNAVTSMINNLNRGIIWRGLNSDFYQLSKRLNKYYEEPWHRSKATLRQQYFSSPWRSASTIAAIILLLLTLIQTVFSILQVV